MLCLVFTVHSRGYLDVYFRFLGECIAAVKTTLFVSSRKTFKGSGVCTWHQNKNKDNSPKIWRKTKNGE